MKNSPKPSRSTRIALPLRGPNTRSGADHLLTILRATPRTHVLDEHDLLPAYIMSVCAAIESRINEAYIWHFHQLLGLGYAPYTAPYLRMRLEEKLGMLVPLITSFRFELQRESPHVKFLFKLFRLRNRLVHHVPHLIEADWHEFGDYARIEYSSGSYRHAHSHPEWERVSRRDLVAVQAALNFWMSALYNLGARVRQKRFNHHGTFKAIPANRRPRVENEA